MEQLPRLHSAQARNRSAGFTLVEVVITSTLIAVVALFVTPHILFSRMRTNELAARETLDRIYQEQLQLGLLPARDADQDGKGEHGFLGEGVLENGLSAIDQGIYERNGYYFEVWLPDDQGQGISLRDAEAGNEPAADAAELHWCCYAWPKRPGITGRHVYFINEAGDMLQRDVARRPNGAQG